MNHQIPIDDLFIVSSDVVLLLRGDDAQRVLLSSPGFSVYYVCAEVHVDSSLWQCAWLQKDQMRKII